MKEILTEISSDKMALFDRKGNLISAPSTWKYQPPLARSDDPATSHAAAEKCKEFKGRHIQRILECLRTHGALIPADIARITGMDYHAVQRRGADMDANGLIVRGPDELHGQRYWRAAK